jgi:hypothetical protein
MYVTPNFKTKKALKEALANGQHVLVYQPNDMGHGRVPTDGIVYLEGPHSPMPHTWYAQGVMKDGKLVSVK